MNIRNLYNVITTPPNESINKRWYVAPFYTVLLWMLFSVLSIFTIDISIITDPFVIFSLIARIVIPVYGVFFIKRFYITGGLKPINYNHGLNFVGYSIAITYVAYILPGVVLDFQLQGSELGIFTLFVVLSTLAPITLYLLLRSPQVKLASTYFTQEDIERSVKIKKDKSLKKANQKLLRAERNIFQNIWFEVLDPLMWAILWVLLINNTLFQLYEIPSSSMVPEFLEKDRVVASKILSGPSLPLTRYHLPEIGHPKVGDIVTFNNPKVDDAESSLHYKSVFTRIFQPFVFMLTFSNVDIDADANGTPKARQLVKRVIGLPGEKISMVNDKVYKKVEGGEWTLLSDLLGHEDWGKNDLFSLDSKNSGNQYMNPALRSELDEAAGLVESQTISMLDSELAEAKSLFIKQLSEIRSEEMIEFKNMLMSYNRQSVGQVASVLDDIERSYIQMMRINRTDMSISSKKAVVEQFNEALEEYQRFVLFDKINDFGDIIAEDISDLEQDFKTTIELPADPSPYDTFVAKLDALNRLRSLELYNKILSARTMDVDNGIVRDLKLMAIYTNGLQFKTYLQPFFGAGNLPEYPAGAGNYIPEGEYFLMGDNRYNSLDSRMGDSYYEISLDEVGSRFSEKATVCWEPHTISDFYIHGKVSFILFPFTHFKFF